MPYEREIELLLVRAQFAEAMVEKVEDFQAKETWRRVAETSRHIARLYQGMDGHDPGPKNRRVRADLDGPQPSKR